MGENKTLRQALDEAEKIRFPTLYVAELEKLRARYGHSIQILPGDKAWLDTFNCFAFALGLVDNPRYRRLVTHHQSSTLANSTFVMSLLRAGELHEISELAASVGSIVLYFDGQELRHAGLIVGSDGTDPATDHQVRSKWGPSEFYEHRLWEVQASYGNRLRFFSPPPPDRILDLLEKHLRDGTAGR